MSTYLNALREARTVLDLLTVLEPQLLSAADLCTNALKHGNKLLVCGNGGSASDAQHLVGELVGRYILNRKPLPAIALNTDGATITCISNDFSYDQIFSRQLEALAKPGDVLIVFTTSGDSPNIIRCLNMARMLQIKSVAFLGRDGGNARALADYPLVLPHMATARIQEGHHFLLHSLMDQIEADFDLATA